MDPECVHLMKHIVHVNQHNIKSNNKTGTKEKPVLTTRTYKTHRIGNGAIIRDPNTGVVLGRFVYSPDKPLACGARVWFETQCDVEITE